MSSALMNHGIWGQAELLFVHRSTTTRIQLLLPVPRYPIIALCNCTAILRFSEFPVGLSFWSRSVRSRCRTRKNERASVDAYSQVANRQRSQSYTHPTRCSRALLLRSPEYTLEMKSWANVTTTTDPGNTPHHGREETADPLDGGVSASWSLLQEPSCYISSISTSRRPLRASTTRYDPHRQEE